MKIELKNLKHYPAFTEETEAFTATVYVDGNRLCTAENTGKGSCHQLTPVKGKTYEDIQRVALWVRSQPKVTVGNGMLLDDDLDFHIARLVDDGIQTKELKKLLGKGVLIYSPKVETNGLFKLSSKFRPSILDQYRKNIKAVYPDCVIINDLPFDQALEFYRNSSSMSMLKNLYDEKHKAY